ncbi:hypothetical protein BRADI_4g10055v3 [Brachypodium distachyon]|uniref:Disease resistance N-terminal domain-containing protein n=1 Tax=Brachypodium distachyon TaxID=15368 RepID=A0A0Q3H1L4_BRADI|nr:hypothetical protein BRADI_4g10055v3 [Brachypodium distachyon]
MHSTGIDRRNWAFVVTNSEVIQELATEEAVLILGVKQELTELQRSMKQIQCFVSDAEQRSIQESAVSNWLGELRDAMYDADNIIDLARRSSGIVLRPPGHPLWRRNHVLVLVRGGVSAGLRGESVRDHQRRRRSSDLKMLIGDAEADGGGCSEGGGGGGGAVEGPAALPEIGSPVEIESPPLDTRDHLCERPRVRNSSWPPSKPSPRTAGGGRAMSSTVQRRGAPPEDLAGGGGRKSPLGMPQDGLAPL